MNTPPYRIAKTVQSEANDHAHLKPLFQEVLATQKTKIADIHMCNPHYNVPIMMLATPIVQESGIIGVMVLMLPHNAINTILHFRSKSNKTGESYRDAKEFQSIIENSQNEIFIFDKESLCFVYVNKGAQSNTGYSYKELLKMTPVDIKPLFTKEEFLDAVAPLLNGELQQVVIETQHRRKDKTLYDVDIRLQLMPFRDKECFYS